LAQRTSSGKALSTDYDQDKMTEKLIVGLRAADKHISAGKEAAITAKHIELVAQKVLPAILNCKDMAEKKTITDTKKLLDEALDEALKQVRADIRMLAGIGIPTFVRCTRRQQGRRVGHAHITLDGETALCQWAWRRGGGVPLPAQEWALLDDSERCGRCVTRNS
jgi:hypothetical protein